MNESGRSSVQCNGVSSVSQPAGENHLDSFSPVLKGSIVTTTTASPAVSSQDAESSVLSKQTDSIIQITHKYESDCLLQVTTAWPR